MQDQGETGGGGAGPGGQALVLEVTLTARSWLIPGLGIAATLAANATYGLGHGPTGAAVAAWPTIALVGSYELHMMIIRSAQVPAGATAGSWASDGAHDDGPLQAQAAQAFAGEVAAGRVPSVSAIRARLQVGQPRVQRVRAYLTALTTG